MRHAFIYISVLLALFIGPTPYTAAQDSSIVEHGLLSKDSLSNSTLNTSLDENHSTKTKAPQLLREVKKEYTNNSVEFYLTISLLIVLGIIRTMDPSYIKNIFSIFLSSSQATHYLKEQILHSKFLNTIMNVFFFFVISIYTSTVIIIKYPNDYTNFKDYFLLFIIVLSGVLVIYSLRLLIIFALGVLFQYKSEANEYTFNIFLVNKVLAVALVPIIAFLVFGSPFIQTFFLYTSFILLAIAFMNRYARTHASVQSIIKLNGIHFLLFLLTTEIIPVALLAKYILTNL